MLIPALVTALQLRTANSFKCMHL